jgi:hypothetical protein
MPHDHCPAMPQVTGVDDQFGTHTSTRSTGTPSEKPLLHDCYIDGQLCRPSNPHSLHSAWSEGAEAEGFEPPVPLGTLAFKVFAPSFRSGHGVRYRWSRPRIGVTWTVVNGDE